MPYSQILRPRSLDQLGALEESLLRDLRTLLGHPQVFPHLILAGPPGTGKTTTARIISQQILGNPTNFNYMELNASNQRGVDTIRNKVISFVSNKSFMKLGSERTPFKIIFLDQADELTREAQTALRNVMESYASNARFIFSCNQHARIIPPLQSRCKLLLYKPLDPKRQLQSMLLLIRKRNLEVPLDKVMYAVNHSRGDMRRACNLLIGEQEVQKVDWMSKTLDLPSNQVMELLPLVRNQLKQDYPSILQRYLDLLLQDRPDWSVTKRFLVLDRLAQVEHAISQGSNPSIQLVGFLGFLLRTRDS